jgi:hypothetical protein
MKQSFVLTLVATLLLVVGSNTVARAETSIIVAQEDAPLKVLNYTTDFDEKDKKALVEHKVKYQNVSPAKIVSARFGILEYNGYGELIDAFCGYTIENSNKGEKDSATVIDIAEHSPFFEDFGEGYIWVDAVRYVDGSLWKVDRVQILAELQKIKPEITETALAGEKCVAAD